MLQKLVDDLDDASAELMLADDDEAVKLQVIPLPMTPLYIYIPLTPATCCNCTFEPHALFFLAASTQ